MNTDSLNELPIDVNLKIFAKHGLDPNQLTEVETDKMKIEHCNNLQYSIFRAIKFILDSNGLVDDDGMDRDLANLAGFGMSLSEATSREMQKMEQYSKEIDIDSSERNN